VYDEINYNVDMMTSNFEMDFFSKETLSAIDSKRSLAKSYAALGVGHWTNLPGTLNEIKAIEKIIDGSVLVAGQEVAEHTVKSMSESGELANYKVIHFATHGLTTSAFPELSAIVLSQLKDSPSKEDGYLRMGEIANLKLNADFVNLSACETG
jgi:CHAT domain-containing protein